MILKVLLVLGVIGIVYFIFFKSKPLKKTRTQKKNTAPKANDMIECINCGLYTEISECILSNGKYYCSTECVNKAK